ncbi:demethylmenaquinone methyltransferase [Aureibacillus halotolerans]|uniref:Demethylmenaquinone methyltransferase n=1 Tax=Aureibacillus halotolerans TaxID=1508390 RepID=A0A4R6UEL1_9BACI|nr:demethylmenaquinone methyltransferase [Aureibacillus halotolerans]TDQ41534.1 2-octaprenyl-6-methoxy-1,4-benzoquinone methylase /demethylmenaquinone methyltransferase [Aureibacillus halotolerans]
MDRRAKEEKVHHVFESIYGKYDKMNSVISFNMHKKWRRYTMKKMNVQAGAHALDVCCGTGDWTVALADKAGKTGRIVGLDFSGNMLKIAKEKKERQQLDHVEYIQGNAMDLPFPNDSFDYVTIGFGLRNVPDYGVVLQEMARVVKPGGKVVCLETSQPTLPVFKQGYFFYFRFIMPLMGKLLAKSYNEYAWLQESAKDFPGKDELAALFVESGLQLCEIKSFTGGVAAMHLAEKPIERP